MAIGGQIYRSLDDAQTWTLCTGGNYTQGKDVNMNQNGSYLYITTGYDNILRYDGTTTLQTYTALATPAAATIAETGLTTGSFTYYYKISRVNTVGFTAASVSVSQTTNKDRSVWDTSNYLTLTLPAYATGQTRYDIYISTDDITYYYLDSQTTPSLTYVDNGSAIPSPSTLAPTDNTTQGPDFAELTNVGERQYGVRSVLHPYRIGFTGTGSFSGAFSSAYDGGYIDWQPGGKLYPVKVVDYRDGKGTPLATVFCKSADGQGCVIQVSLDTLTVGDISITVPSAYRLPGSRGTPAPNSVINVLNDFYFYNSQAFYNLGSRAQFLNLLSTDEISANIRPTVKQISSNGEQNICAIYYFARVYISVNYGSSTNNYTAVYDTERKAWLPKAFTLGFKKFLRYTDTSGNKRLLAFKQGDSQLSEINDDILGDYGQPFNVAITTGLYPTVKDRFDFQFVEEGDVEFSNPQGSITAELLGIDRSTGYRTVKSIPIHVSTTTTNVGWDTFNWDAKNWDDTSTVPETFSESSVKRYFTLLKELNAVQWRVTSNSLDAKFILRSLQTWGTPTQAGKPRQWRVT